MCYYLMTLVVKLIFTGHRKWDNLLFCITLLPYASALLLCRTFVSYFSVLVLCRTFVLHFCVVLLCLTSVSHFCVLLLSCTFLSYFSVLLMCLTFVSYFCVLLLCLTFLSYFFDSLSYFQQLVLNGMIATLVFGNLHTRQNKNLQAKRNLLFYSGLTSSTHTPNDLLQTLLFTS